MSLVSNFTLGILLVVTAASITSLAAGDQNTTHEYIPLDGLTMLQKTTIHMHVPSDNLFPWGYVRGTIENPVLGHSVIIQMFQNDQPVHFAQVDVQEHGQYEYRFRALDETNGTVTRIFEGDYQVVIFKVVYNFDTLL